MKSKKIIFSAANNIADNSYSIPKSSIHHVPNWYKNQKLFSNKTNNIIEAEKLEDTFGTYKLCVPLIDSLTSGYMISLNTDILVFNQGQDEYLPQITWKSLIPEPLDIQDSYQKRTIGNYPIPIGYSPTLLRWHSDWTIRTPKNYSLWVTHPSHRHDLPFFTLNGFIDTDKFPNTLALPFFIREGFEGIIEKGTPVAQILPIKRDSWISEKNKYDEQKIQNGLVKLRLHAIRGYKREWWTRKIYK